MSGSHYRSGFLPGSDASSKHVLRYGTATLGGVVGHTGTGDKGAYSDVLRGGLQLGVASNTVACTGFVRGAGGVEPATATKATSSLTQPNEKSTHSSREGRSPCQTSSL
jgi:hypothetical protein